MKRFETDKMPAYNEQFGITAAGRADLKGSAGMPPLRQAAIPQNEPKQIGLIRFLVLLQRNIFQKKVCILQ